MFLLLFLLYFAREFLWVNSADPVQMPRSALFAWYTKWVSVRKGLNMGTASCFLAKQFSWFLDCFFGPIEKRICSIYRMDHDLRLYACLAIFQSYQDVNERLCAIEPCLQLVRLLPRSGLEPGTVRKTGQRSTYWVTGSHLYYRGEVKWKWQLLPLKVNDRTVVPALIE